MRSQTSVYLIGAGPGDEELLTLKAQRVLQKCTAIMYDHLANPSVLRYAPDACELHYCGKTPGHHTKPQEEINDWLVALVRAGHVVGRVKGGDPYLFGRGGEEAVRLYAEGIPFEVIPGISSPLAVLNYAGIPATQRGLAQGLHIYTGTSADTLNINWEAAAHSQGTLIFLMGLGNLSMIAAHLKTHGKPPQTPCAVIMRGTTAKQRKVVGTLDQIVELVNAAELTSPSIIVVGEVVTFAHQLAWYEQKPLFGRHLCITRAQDQARDLRERLWDLGAEVTEINTIQVVKNEAALLPFLPQLPGYDFFIFTSVNGVKTLFDMLRAQMSDIRQLRGAFAAIGPATANALQERGIIPAVIAPEFIAEALYDALQPRLTPGARIFVARSRQARPYLVEQLRAQGCVVDEVPIYHVEPGQLRAQTLDEVDTIIFTSPTTVRNLIAMTSLEQVSAKHALAIGPITSAELEQHGITAQVCTEYSVDGIIQKLLT